VKQAFRYRIVTEWSDEDQAFLARVPAFPGCIAHGETAEKATHEAARAAELMLDVLREDRKGPPPEDAVADFSGQLRLRLPKSLHEQVSRLATAEGVSLNTLLLSLVAEACGRRSPRPASEPAKSARSGKRKAAA
jgi:antitoxin HicB